MKRSSRCVGATRSSTTRRARTAAPGGEIERVARSADAWGDDVARDIAVALGDDGLIVPVIRNAHELSHEGLAARIADVAERARAKRLSPDETKGGTFTITNPGRYGALLATPIINQPQVAILDLEAVVKRPVVVQDPGLGEVIAVRSMVYLALTYDHRIVDGADAARFLTTVRERLEAGQFEGELGLG